MRWKTGPVRKRHVPEPERLCQLVAKLKGEADNLSQKADALLAEAEALEAANQQKRKQPDSYTRFTVVNPISHQNSSMSAIACFHQFTPGFARHSVRTVTILSAHLWVGAKSEHLGMSRHDSGH
jgi:hypothetical protein